MFLCRRRWVGKRDCESDARGARQSIYYVSFCGYIGTEERVYDLGLSGLENL